VTSRLHHQMIRSLLDQGACPSNSHLAYALGLTPPALNILMQDLEALHGVVLHPHAPEPWVIHPFSLTPTLNWVEGQKHGWWAPCIWCALGVATLAGGDVRIHTRWEAETEPLVIHVRDGQPQNAFSGTCVHFAIPPARAWDNVHRHCSLVLPFRSELDIRDWCARYNQPRGEAVPLDTVALLARRWYGHHADPEWRKWTIDEAQRIFHDVGLTSTFWDLGAKIGRF